MIPTVVDTILRAMGQALPDRAVAAHHGIYGVHSLFGRLPDSGERFFNLDTVTGGWGASATVDGAGPFRSNAHGDVPDVPVEMQEALFPYRLTAKALIADSGGAGRHRGGLGVEKQYRFAHPCHVIAQFDRVACPPWGLEGGQARGSSGQMQIILAADGTEEVFFKGERELRPGDELPRAAAAAAVVATAIHSDRPVDAVEGRCPGPATSPPLDRLAHSTAWFSPRTCPVDPAATAAPLPRARMSPA